MTVFSNDGFRLRYADHGVGEPVLLVHGDMDDVVPAASLPQAAEALQAAGFTEVYAHIIEAVRQAKDQFVVG